MEKSLLYVIGILIIVSITIVSTLYFKKCKVCGSSQLTGISEDEKWSDRFKVDTVHYDAPHVHIYVMSYSVLHGGMRLDLSVNSDIYDFIKPGDNIIISNYPMNPTKKPEKTDQVLLTNWTFDYAPPPPGDVDIADINFPNGYVALLATQGLKNLLYIPKLGETIYLYIISIP